MEAVLSHHQQTKLVAGHPLAAPGHSAGRPNPQGSGRVAKPQQIGRDVGGDRRQCFTIPAGLGRSRRKMGRKARPAGLKDRRPS